MISTNFPGGGNDTQGVNLLTGTKDFSSWKNKRYWQNDGTYKGCEVFKRTGDWSGLESPEVQITKGEYTLSVYVKCTKGAVLELILKSGAGIQPGIVENSFQFEGVETEFTRISHVYKVTKDVSVSPTICIKNDASHTLWVAGMKLEPGIVKDPIWTPAPEDIATHTDVEQAVTGENLCIDGNYVLNLADDLVQNIPDSSVPSKKCISFNTRANINASGVYLLLNVNIGVTYTISVYIKADKNLRLNILTGTLGHMVDVGTDWKKYEIVDSFVSELALSFYIEGTTTPSTKIYLSSLKVEEGYNSHIFYTPSPTDQLFHALDPIPEMHRNLYRGRNLGESTQMSAEHKDAIADGSFRGLWVGDYWTHNNVNWRIADADYFYNCGDKAFTTHHLVMIPDTGLYTAAMNSSNTTDGGYVGSEMRTKNLTQAREMAEEAFPGMVLSHRDYFVNKCTNGKPSGRDWYDSELELMNEIMLYGSKIFSVGNDGVTIPTLYTTANSQLSLFQLNPKFIKTRQNYWLRDVVSAAYFASVDSYGYASSGSASDSCGVRPYFCIGVQASADEAEDDMEVVPSVGNPERMEADEMDDSDLDMSTMGDPLDTTY